MGKLPACLVLSLAAWAGSRSDSFTGRICPPSAPVYKSEQDSVLNRHLFSGDHITVLRKGKFRSLVKTAFDTMGWVDNSKIENTEDAPRKHDLMDVEVRSWLGNENVNANYMMEDDWPLPLDRNFDHETVDSFSRLHQDLDLTPRSPIKP